MEEPKEITRLKKRVQELESRLSDEKKFHLEDCQARDELIKQLKSNNGMGSAFIEIFKLQQETIMALFKERNGIMESNMTVISDLIASIGSGIGATIAQNLPLEDPPIKKEIP